MLLDEAITKAEALSEDNKKMAKDAYNHYSTGGGADWVRLHDKYSTLAKDYADIAGYLRELKKYREVAKSFYDLATSGAEITQEIQEVQGYGG